MARFSWDESKRREHIDRRRVDFIRVTKIFDGPFIENVDARALYGEERYVALGEAEGERYVVVVYTWRGAKRHIITAWKVDEAGSRRYQRILARGLGRHGSER
jgi:uncharacterized DUF497 family protein